MNQPKQMKICPCCKHVFAPILSDKDFLHLFHDAETIERAEFLEQEYPGHSFELHAPQQILCAKCTMNPRLRVKFYFGGKGKFYLATDEELKKEG